MRSRAEVEARLFLFAGGPCGSGSAPVAAPCGDGSAVPNQSGTSECDPPTRAPLSSYVQRKPARPRPDAARLYASPAPGPARLSSTLRLRPEGSSPKSGQSPGSKVRTWFEGAHCFSKVRILENLGDFFEDAHPFPRCARKSEHLRRGTETVGTDERGDHPLKSLVFHAGAVAQSVRAADS
jgi:hypothetical protein